MYEFETELIRPEGTGTWTYLTVPFNVEEALGHKAQVKVKGTINGINYRASLMPHGNGKHYMVVNKPLREEAKVKAGDRVNVRLEVDSDIRHVEVPEDFLTMLATNADAIAFFNDLAYSYQKEYAEWIQSAKKPETRADRISKSIAKLEVGKKLK
jgi:hypothetical protein